MNKVTISTISNRDIFIIDDVISNIKLLSGILENEGYSVRSFLSGDLALASLTETLPSIILLDIMMPDMDGFEVCRKLKGDSRTCDIPVVFISALTDEDSKLTGFDTGGVDFITKPFRKNEVLARVKTQLKLYELQVDLRIRNEKLKAEIIRRDLAETNLRKFKMGIDHSADAIFITSTDGTIEYINQSFEDVYGFSASEAIGCTPRIIKSEIYDQLYYENFWKTLLDKKTIAREIENKTKDGRLISIESRNNPILDDNGHIVGFISINRDITERKRAEQALRESEEKFRNLAETSPFSICIYQDNRLVYANPVSEKISGYTIEELSQMAFADLVAPEFQELILERAKDRLEGHGLARSYEFRIVTKEGDSKWIYLGGSSIVYKGKPAGIISIVDITSRKKYEEALIEAEEKMQAFFDQSLDGFFFMMFEESIAWNELIDKDMQLDYAFKHLHITRVNDAMLEQYGATRDQFMGLTPADMFAHDIMHGKNTFHRLFDTGKLKAETDERKLNGEQIIIEGDYACLYDSNGRITGLFGIQRDITQDKMFMESTRNDRKILRTLIDNLPDAIYVKDIDARKVVANRFDVENIGFFDEAETLGKTDLELFPGEIGARGYADDLVVFKSGKSVVDREEYFFDKYGNQRWLLTSKIPLFDQQGKIAGLVGIGRDITKQKEADETIKKLSKSIEQSPSSIVITDVAGNIEYVNPKFTEITGYPSEEVIGKNPRVLKSGEMTAETYRKMWSTISAGEVWRGEFHNRRKNGELYWEWATITSIKNEKGQITNYIAIKEDIGDRKQLEVDLLAAKNKAEENDRLKSAFLANMSHEIRTPLNSIIGFSEILSDPEFDTDERYEFAKIITNSGNNLLSIISDIMDISKIEAGQVEVRKTIFSVQKLIQDVHNEFKIKALEKNISFKITPNIDELDFMIESDQTKLKQILVNFVGNALKFADNGTVEIGVKVDYKSIMIYVKDDGIGIPLAYHNHIFERFRQVEASTTRKYGGNGLGLAISKSLIEMLGGTIGMESEPGKGSIFYFNLPNVLL